MNVWTIFVGIVATIILVLTLSISLKKRIFKRILRYSKILNNEKSQEDNDNSSILEIYDYLEFYDFNEWDDN